MKIQKVTFAFILSLGLFSCTESTNESTDETTSNEEVVNEETVVEEETTEIDIDAMIDSIDAKRENIESTIGEPLVVKTDSLRAKTKQKWKTIHFYAIDGKLARIKTYPYPEISERTEEYYVENDKLILAVIEDNGNSERGKSKEEVDKMYYFNDGSVLKEHHSEKENEYSVRDSDGEELLTEFNEYMEVYVAHSQK